MPRNSFTLPIRPDTRWKKKRKKEKDLIEEFIDVAHQAWHQGEEERKNKKK